jgi:glucose/arabinose dehydrogenase
MAIKTSTTVFVISSIVIVLSFFNESNGQQAFRENNFLRTERIPSVADSNLEVELVVGGLQIPTTMAFLGPDDFIVLEKDEGTVVRVTNGVISSKPLLDVNVANSVERGMLGVAVSKNDFKTYVFLYYTQINGNDSDDRKGLQPEANRVYRYELVGNELVNPILLLDLPANPGPRHNGGAMEIGPDNNLYIPIGDVDASYRKPIIRTMTQNFGDGLVADGRSGILRVTQNGKPIGEGILGDSMPLKFYYAYGIRNSFGLGFDPVTNHLWQTENGPTHGDEINLVYPGFNSGWHEMYGFSYSQQKFDINKLVTFEGKGKYSEPKLVWGTTAGLTSLIFLNSDKLGNEYRNDMFIGDVHNGRIYHFKLNTDRTELALPKSLASKFFTSFNAPGVEEILFGQGFGGITDLTVGPDGYLYVVSIGQGKVFRILPSTIDSNDIGSIPPVDQANMPTTNLSMTNDIDAKNNELVVSIDTLKDTVARGDSQSTTITVTDSVSRPVANAKIDGILIYPGDNFEKEFSGITDFQGNFIYSWIIGENGDSGSLAIETEVSKQGYHPSSAESSFSIVDSSDKSE